MFCKDCGSKLDERSKVCKNCNPDSRRSNKSNDRWKMIALSSLALLLVVGVGIIASLFISRGDAESDLADGGLQDNVEVSGESTELVSTDPDENEQAADDDQDAKAEAARENERLRLENEKLQEEMKNKEIMLENELLKERIETMNRRASNQSNYNPSTGYYGNTYRITWDDLNNLSKSDIEMLRNEIYARNGYIFSKQPFINYFGSQSWYQPNSGFHEGLFNSIEKANIETLVNYESHHGWR